MIIREVEVRDFAILRGPLRLSFDRGVNVIHGDNETGKTTLLRAIDWCLSRRSRAGGKELKLVEPRDGGVPEVRVRFESDGLTFDVAKRFRATSGTTKLVVEDGGGRLIEELSGEDAEAKLHAVLGFRASASRGRKSQDGELDIWPLIRVEQGRSGVAPSQDLNDQSRGRLSDLLAKESGEVLAGPGAEHLLERVREEFEIYFTKTGREKSGADASPLSAAKFELEEAKLQLVELQDRQREHERTIEEYAKLDRRSKRLEEDLPGFRKAFDDAKSALEKVEQLAKQLESIASRTKLVEREWQGLSETRELRLQILATLADRKSLLDASSAKLLAAQRSSEEHSKRREQIEDESRAAQEDEKSAKTRLRELRRQRDLLVAREELGRASERLAASREQQRRLVEGKSELERFVVSDKSVARLEKLHSEAEKAKARLEAASASIEVRALSDVELNVDGRTERVSGGHSIDWHASDRTKLRIGDLAEIEITPAGEELISLRAAEAKAAEALVEVLTELKVGAVPEARRLNEERRDLERELRSVETRVKDVAPEGVETLAATVAALERRVEELQASAGEEPVQLEQIPTDIAAADTALDSQESASENAQTRRASADKRLSEFERQRVAIQGELKLGLCADREANAASLAELARGRIDAAGPR